MASTVAAPQIGRSACPGGVCGAPRGACPPPPPRPTNSEHSSSVTDDLHRVTGPATRLEQAGTARRNSGRAPHTDPRDEFPQAERRFRSGHRAGSMPGDSLHPARGAFPRGIRRRPALLGQLEHACLAPPAQPTSRLPAWPRAHDPVRVPRRTPRLDPGARQRPRPLLAGLQVRSCSVSTRSAGRRDEPSPVRSGAPTSRSAWDASQVRGTKRPCPLSGRSVDGLQVLGGGPRLLISQRSVVVIIVSHDAPLATTRARPAPACASTARRVIGPRLPTVGVSFTTPPRASPGRPRIVLARLARSPGARCRPRGNGHAHLRRRYPTRDHSHSLPTSAAPPRAHGSPRLASTTARRPTFSLTGRHDLARNPN
jgi:hypothetical protein